jgi:two-component system sensor histidine kinase ChiS
VPSNAPSSKPQPASDAFSAPSAPRLRVLAADDDPVNLSVLRAQLEAKQVDIVTANDGIEALRKLESEGPFDVVLLDVMMPKLSGYDVCRRVRELHSAAELPVLLLTAKTQVKDLAAGFDAGANDYLTKPLSRTELLARIRTHAALSKKNQAYARFVPREMLHLLGHQDVVGVRLGDHIQRQLTILFCDVRNFSGISEHLSPLETFAFLNAWLERLGPCVRDHGGFVDKYIGDAVMALFPTGARSALEAGLAIFEEARTFNKEQRLGMPQVKVGIGIHDGTTLVGTVGEERRMDATVISDAVNLAARIEGLTHKLRAGMLVSEGVIAAIDDRARYAPRNLGAVRVKGRTGVVPLVEICAADEPRLRLAKEREGANFAAGVKAFYEGAFGEALPRFEAVLRAVPDDGPATFFATECRERLTDRESLPQWDGVLEFREK